MLTAINGYSDLTLRHLATNDPLRRNIEEIRKAGDRAAILTNQLLAYSRKQILAPKLLNINDSLAEISSLLKSLVGDKVTVNLNLADDLGMARVDPTQLTQIIMNLTDNARDAMPDGGQLTIATANVCFDEQYVSEHIGSQPGNHVMLAITDTGFGITGEQLEHIWEPFYTTKEFGQGSGLGLSTVYGIVKQSGGHIWYFSEAGSGSTFQIYLPRVDESSPVEQLSASVPAHGDQTILLVEDEEIVRNLTRQMLLSCGFTVIDVADADDAIAICNGDKRRIDLLCTDVVMPKMSGPQLAAMVVTARPAMKVLYMSGYHDDALLRDDVDSAGLNFIAKPFSFDDLARRVKGILDIDGQ